MAQDTRFKNFTDFERELFERQRKIKDVLPEGLRVDRFMALTKLMVSENLALLGCARASLISAVYKGARDGLEFGVDAVIVPVQQEARYLQYYSGIITMLTRTGLVAKAFAEVVYSGDEFNLDYGDAVKPIRHIPARSGRGELEGAYAAIVFKNSFWHVHYMDEPDIERVLSEGRKDKLKETDPWVKHKAEMWRKTAMHNAAKYCPTSSQIRALFARDAVEEMTAEEHIAEMFDRSDGRPEPLPVAGKEPARAHYRADLPPEPAAVAVDDRPDLMAQEEEEEGF